MKEGWTYKKLGEVFRTYAGGTPSKSNKANYENGTIPWIRSGEVCRKYITESELYISEEGLRNSSAKYYPINTVLVAMYGATAAQCGILKFEATSNQAVCGILPQDDFSPEFVYAYFTYIKDYLAAQAQGGAQPNISQEKIKNILFPCIQLSEQRHIVSRLDTAFAQIDALKANAEKQLAEARALFQKALEEAMRPKEGWEEKTLGEVCAKSKNIRWEEYKDDKPFTYIDLTSVDRESLTIIDPQIIDSNNAPSRAKQIIEEGDIIFATTRPTLRRVCLITEDYNGQICSTGFCVLRPQSQIISKWIFYSLLNEEFYQYIEPLQTGASYPAVTDGIVKNYSISFPSSVAYQQQIVSQLDSLSAKVRELEEVQRKTIAECDALKQAMLREVFE